MILVTGAYGQLGSCMMTYLQKNKIPCCGVGREQFDISDYDAVQVFVVDTHPKIVIHCAAYSKVDQAETESEKCFSVNADGAKHVAVACADVGAKLLYLSTDYVFDGEKQGPYEVDDPTHPLTVYGQSKLMGEQQVLQHCKSSFVVRTSLLFGQNGRNFVSTMLKSGRKHKRVIAVTDQISSPTYTEDLAPLLLEIVSSDRYGIYHATNEGFCSIAEFAQEIFAQTQCAVEISGVNYADFGSHVSRPLNSRLSKSSLDISGFCRLPDWKDALRRYLITEGQVGV